MRKQRLEPDRAASLSWEEPVHDWTFEVRELDRMQRAVYWKQKLEDSTWQCDACGHRARVRDERECQECGRPWTNDPVFFGLRNRGGGGSTPPSP